MHYNYGSEDSLLLRCQLSLNTSVDLLPVKISKVFFFFGRNWQADSEMFMETQKTFPEHWKRKIVEDLTSF